MSCTPKILNVPNISKYRDKTLEYVKCSTIFLRFSYIYLNYYVDLRE